MATQYEVTINMSDGTVTQLMDGNFSFFGFKAVRSSVGGKPLVWFKTQEISDATSVTWQEQYEAYTSQTEIDDGTTIVASKHVDIDLGQVLEVTSPQGVSHTTSGGLAGAISIHNNTTTPFTCGISEQSNKGTASAPLCAFPLHGGMVDVIVPIEMVLLTFATDPVNTGTVIEQAFAQGYLIDLTEAPDNSRSVNFDIDLGWSNDENGTWAVPVAPKEDLLQHLIDDSSNAAKALAKKAA